MQNLVDISYQQTGASTTVDAMGMREMQRMAYEQRNRRYLLVKAPPASGKSRAMMFVALDKLANQGIRKVIVAVPEIDRTLVRQYGIKEIRLLRRLESGAVLQSLRCEERKGEGKTVPGVHIQRHQPDSGLHPCDTAYLHEANRRRATERLFFRH